MKIFGNNPSFPDSLKPLFDAMKSGQKIKSITCMAGSINADNPAKDFQIKNFIATHYWAGIGGDADGNQYDYVDTDAPETRLGRKKATMAFYMNWIRDFEL